METQDGMEMTILLSVEVQDRMGVMGKKVDLQWKNLGPRLPSGSQRPKGRRRGLRAEEVGTREDWHQGMQASGAKW